MAAYAVSTAQLGVHAKKLEAEVVDAVTFSTKDVDILEIISDGAAAIYFTVTDAEPTVAGQNTRMIPAALSSYTLSARGQDQVVIKLISAGTPTYSVQQAP